MKLIKKCVKCSSFTLKPTHCSESTISVHPAKFSIEDKYGEYRRKAKGFY
ncbi:ribosome biogenesis protein [Candidatus Micrarchaeota archaeon]|nr:ribosome biogenesis protein [Candidatus Micrarchaeota archaeon]